MTRRSLQFDRLQNMLSAVERMLLDAPDNELLEIVANKSTVADVGGLITRAIKNREAALGKRGKSRERVGSRDRRPTKSGAVWAKRLALLRQLVRARPEFGAQVAAVLSAGKRASRSDIEKLLREVQQSTGTSSKDRGAK